MDVRTGKWERCNASGEPPSPRAAHAAAAVGSMVVIQGGIGPAGLAPEDLHVLDFTDISKPRWHRLASPSQSFKAQNVMGAPAMLRFPLIVLGFLFKARAQAQDMPTPWRWLQTGFLWPLAETMAVSRSQTPGPWTPVKSHIAGGRLLTVEKRLRQGALCLPCVPTHCAVKC
eukprot:scaffold161872_cov33-Prasinocladus_malaysianus.AAC.1